jgi:hypothetical protein
VQRLQRGEAVSVTVAMVSPEGPGKSGQPPAALTLQVTMLDTDIQRGPRAADGPSGQDRRRYTSTLSNST